ncbi:transposable element Tcb2 transposase [Trichonephila clavipes]|nr:transposable element Tcb2 transposase [Trichonephila clavipes]
MSGRYASKGRLTSFSVEYKTVRRCWDQWTREKSFTRRPGSGRPRHTSRREDRPIVRNSRVQPTASSATIQAHIILSIGTIVSSRTIRRCLAEGHLVSRCPLRVLPLMPTHRCLRLEWGHTQGNWTATEWNHVVFNDESRFNLSSDGNRVRLWRPLGERLNPAFALQRHTTLRTGVMPPFNKSMLDLTARVSQDCLRNVTTFPWPSRSPELSPIEHIWNHLRRLAGHPTSLNELEAMPPQIWNKMSQDMIQNLYASMSDRFASCIRAGGGSTGNCDENKTVVNTSLKSVPTSHDVNLRITQAFSHIGKGYSAIEKFCMVMNIDPFSSTTYGKCARRLDNAYTLASENIFAEIHRGIKNVYENGAEIADLCVSFDGTG